MNVMFKVSGGSKGGHEGRPPGGPNSFNFLQFWGKFGKIVCWRPPGELAPPPREILDPPLKVAVPIGRNEINYSANCQQ